MKDKKFEDFWLEKSKEEIINAYRECIHNGEVLLSRINKAIEYMEEINTHLYVTNFDTEYIINILKGSDSNDIMD